MTISRRIESKLLRESLEVTEERRWTINASFFLKHKVNSRTVAKGDTHVVGRHRSIILV